MQIALSLKIKPLPVMGRYKNQNHKYNFKLPIFLFFREFGSLICKGNESSDARRKLIYMFNCKLSVFRMLMSHQGLSPVIAQISITDSLSDSLNDSFY